MNQIFKSLPVTNKQKIFVLACFVLFFLLWVSYFVATHGFIAITYNANTADTELVITASDKSSKTIQSYESGKKIFVKKGSYNVSLSGGNTSAFATSEAPGFLSATTTPLTLQSDANITVVANVNDGCINVANNIVYEYNCEKSRYLSKIMSATPNRPSYTNKDSDESSTIHGIATTSNGTQVQLKSYSFYEYPPQYPYILLVNGQKIDIPYELGDSPNILKYLDGFILFSQNSSIVYIYDTPNSIPKTVDLDLKNLDENTTISTTVKGNYITQYPAPSGDEENVADTNTTIAYYDGSTVGKIQFNKAYDSVMVCEEKRLCVIKDGFTVYDVSTDSPKELSTVFDGQNMIGGSDEVYIATSTNILRSTIKEAVTYQAVDTFTQNNSCGLYYFDTLYACRIANELGKKLVVKYDFSTPKTEDIITQLNELTKNNDVEIVTINNQYIFINAKYPSQSGASNITPEQKASIFESINNTINEQKIDRTKYTIRIL